MKKLIHNSNPEVLALIDRINLNETRIKNEYRKIKCSQPAKVVLKNDPLRTDKNFLVVNPHDCPISMSIIKSSGFNEFMELTKNW